jgi:basic membrane protein A
MFNKRSCLLLAVLLMVALVVSGCGGSAPTGKPADGTAGFKVGMVTDAGTIDDKSFNQGTWEGVVKAGKDFGLETRYLKPNGTTEADYVKEIGNLFDAGFRLMVTPGFKFETAIYQAQDKYPDAKFILIDGSPHAGDWNPVVKNNTVSIFFAEHESGFLAGVATALQLQEGQVGFIGGMEIPPVQKFNWGFQQGIQHANDNFGTKVGIQAENVVYQGSFDNVAAGQQLAAQMYDKGVKTIFAAAGGVGIGAINEAKSRAKAGKEAWIIGVDVDQFAEGIYEGNKSIILTSAMKRIDQAAYDMIKAEKEGDFPGGETLVFSAANNGIGIPAVNPNLSDDVQQKVENVFKELQAGKIIVSSSQGSLIK